MALLSPGIEIKEKDFTTIVPQVATSFGGIVVDFEMGPINTPILLTSEEDMLSIFGRPNDANANAWFTAAEFLKYSSRLWAVRSGRTGANNANAAGVTGVSITSLDDYDLADKTSSPWTTYGAWISKEVGARANDIQVIMVDSATWSAFKTWADANKNAYPNKKSLASYFTAPPSTSYEVAQKAGSGKNDELHILVIDAVGKITGTKNAVLEVFEGLSKCSDARDDRLQPIYYTTFMNLNSEYVYFANYPTAVEAASAGSKVAWGSNMEDVYGAAVFCALTSYQSNRLSKGSDGSPSTAGQIESAYELLGDVQRLDVNLMMTATYSNSTVQKILTEILPDRKDCVAFVTPHNSGKPYTGNASTITTSYVTFKETLSIADEYAMYGFMDSGFKYVFDKYNNKYRWVPLNGDMAGLCAKTDATNDAWWSPAGYNRGGLKNVLKLSFNPTEAYRDVLYSAGINSVIATPGSGTILFGDKTMTSKPSAFDRINVRRLFNILEKAIATAAKYSLFEFNDSTTRTQFKNMIEPFLRGIQGGRGISDFYVRCDESNNPGSVIDSNRFVADIAVKPQRSINFITLNFIATKTDVAFSTVLG